LCSKKIVVRDGKLALRT
jgi:hypothetical protein